MAGKRLSGVLPVFQTPFAPDGSVDHASLTAELDWVFDNGVDGIVFAMVSEVLRLSSEERDEVAALACNAAAGRGAAVISVGAESAVVARRHARHAEACGADAVMATPPALHRVGEHELLRYFVDIAAAVSVPLIVQDASGYLGAPISVPLQARLHAELGERVLFKPEAPPIGPRVTQLLDATGGRAKVFEGTGGLHLIESFRRGAVGTMPAADLVWALVALWRSLEAGDFGRAYQIAGPLALIVSLQSDLDSYVSIEKHLLVRQGVLPSAAMREPIGHGPDDLTFREVDRRFELLRDAVNGASGPAPAADPRALRPRAVRHEER